jgi:hypothetical protein
VFRAIVFYVDHFDTPGDFLARAPFTSGGRKARDRLML